MKELFKFILALYVYFEVIYSFCDHKNYCRINHETISCNFKNVPSITVNNRKKCKSLLLFHSKELNENRRIYLNFTGSFKYLPSLNRKIFNTFFIKCFTNSTFCDSIKSFDLSNNNFESIPDVLLSIGDKDQFNYLESLLLINCRLNYLNLKYFPKSLKILDLSYNPLVFLSKYPFKNLLSLKRLSLNGLLAKDRNSNNEFTLKKTYYKNWKIIKCIIEYLRSNCFTKDYETKKLDNQSINVDLKENAIYDLGELWLKPTGKCQKKLNLTIDNYFLRISMKNWKNYSHVRINSKFMPYNLNNSITINKLEKPNTNHLIIGNSIFLNITCKSYGFNSIEPEIVEKLNNKEIYHCSMHSQTKFIKRSINQSSESCIIPYKNFNQSCFLCKMKDISSYDQRLFQ